MTTSNSIEMPKYQCHKIVHALKIRCIVNDILTPENYDRYAPFVLSEDFIKKFNPQPGGYYVVYEDGYKSYSPAEAFEKGYTLINEN